MKEKKIQPYGQQFYAPAPTGLTKLMRTNIFVQLWRFFVLNIKILRMVRKH
jgi:hypothetical protein